MKFFLTFIFSLYISHATAAETIQMAITVDDLPVHGALPQNTNRLQVAQKMTEVLKKYKIPEVYGFINAGNIEFQKNDLEVLKTWRKADYPLANHSYSHMDLHKSSVEDFQNDILRNEKWLKELNSDLNWKFFRYPYLREGDTIEKRNSIRQFLNNNKYQIAQVTVDFEDWAWNEPYARCKNKNDTKSIEKLKKSYLEHADQILDRSVKITNHLFKRPVKHILLLHIGAFDAEMLEDLIKLYQKKGVQFISLSEAATDEIYKIDPGVVGKWGAELPYQILKSKNIKLKDIGADTLAFPATEYPEEFLAGFCK
ncbi:polysaccharide deacetylase family protein [bacterium]|nr:polysaccharide deacetylase family protein [bacterium]